MKQYITLCLFSLLMLPMCVACTGPTQAERNRADAEQKGAVLLDEARQALRAKQYDKARRTVMQLRSEAPLALDARRRAILLLDSIELAASRDSVRFVHGEEWERLTLKMQFYERKLQEDIKAYGE